MNKKTERECIILTGAENVSSREHHTLRPFAAAPPWMALQMEQIN